MMSTPFDYYSKIIYTNRCEGHIFICLADSSLKVETAYYFLDLMKNSLFSKYSAEDLNKSVGIGNNFKKEIQKIMDDVNNNPEIGKSKEIIQELSGIKNQAADNLGKLIFESR